MHLFRTYLSRFALGAALLLPISAANAALLKSYDFNGDLSDTLGNGLDLLQIGPNGVGTAAGGRYTFEPNQGLRLDETFADTANYGIEIKFQTNKINEFNSSQKLIDFNSLNTDFGLYTVDTEADFYDLITPVGSIVAGTDLTVGLFRQNNILELWIDGIVFATENDPLPGKAVSALNILYFFIDDTVTDQNERFAGSADFIRIHDDSSTFGMSPVPVPAAVWLFGTALIGLIGFGRRRVKD